MLGLQARAEGPRSVDLRFRLASCVFFPRRDLEKHIGGFWVLAAADLDEALVAKCFTTQRHFSLMA
jgi:hypothetical protein